MLDIDKMKELINIIVTNQYYEGDFGDTLDDDTLILSGVDDKNIVLPDDYITFIKKIGYGELDASFYIEDGPIKFSKIYGREQEGLYLIASDMSEYVYAFDANNDFLVVEIDSSGEISKELGSFESFIKQEIYELIETCDWRDKNW